MSDKNTKTIELPSVTTVRDLAKKVNSSPIQVIKVLMANGVMANINQQIYFDTAAVVAAELGFEAAMEVIEVKEEQVGEVPLWRRMIEQKTRASWSIARRLSPFLACRSRQNHLAGRHPPHQRCRRRVRGITQHIGAYQVEHKKKRITFLDTPATRLSPPCARAAPRAPILSSWWWRPTTA
jgi:translation initiation factor IF-2